MAEELNLLKISKGEIKRLFRVHAKDTGSANVQIALLTRRIERLTEHLKNHGKDHNSRYGLIKMVSVRRKLLDYLRRENEEHYQALIKRLRLRK